MKGTETDTGSQMKGCEGRQMKGDKAAASGQSSGFGDQRPSHWEVRTPIASSYLGNEGRQMKAGAAKSRQEWRSCRETNEGRQMKALSGRVPKPRPTPLSLRPVVYIILRGPNVTSSIRVSAAAEYYRRIPRFTEDSLSHSFPSIAEANIYCIAAGVDFPPCCGPMTDAIQDIAELGALESNPGNLLLLKLPPDVGTQVEWQETFAVPVLTRSAGFMIAVPHGFVPAELLTMGEAASQEDMFGPSLNWTYVSQQFWRRRTEARLEMDCLLLDLHISALPLLRRYDPVTEGPENAVCAGSHGLDPEFKRSCREGLRMFGTLRRTESLLFSGRGSDSCSSCPPCSSKEDKPSKTEDHNGSGCGTAIFFGRYPIYILSALGPSGSAEAFRGDLALFRRQGEFRGSSTGGGEGWARSFLKTVAPPPRVRASLRLLLKKGKCWPLLEDEPVLLPTREDYLQGMRRADPAAILMQQFQALTALVSRMASQEGALDFSGSSSSSAISFGKEGETLGRPCKQEGRFHAEGGSECFAEDEAVGTCPPLADSKYLEKHGGYSGAHDMGLVMWLLGNIADLMVQSDFVGVGEMMDCADWAAATLSFVKEVDIINNRRQEALDYQIGKALNQAFQSSQQKQPKFPKKPKKTEEASTW